MINFLNNGHKETFQELEEVAQTRPGEKDFKAAIYILSCPLLASRCEKYIKPREIGFTDLMDDAQVWSSSEKGLLSLAAALFNSAWKADINNVFWNLDDDNTALALEALKIRFT